MIGPARGRFIALEGIDGSGKSTQTALLAEALRATGVEVMATREPGGTALGEAVRALLLDRENHPAPLAELHLFLAARAQLVREVILPALGRGAWVVSDRFVDSSLAYQGAARGLGVDLVWRANEALLAGDGPAASAIPDAALVIDVSPELAARRRCARPDRIEAEGADLQRRVAAGYHALADRFPERVRLIDGAGPPEQVHARVWDHVGRL